MNLTLVIKIDMVLCCCCNLRSGNMMLGVMQECDVGFGMQM